MASSSSSPPAPDNNNKRTRLDRSIAVVLENPDETPSLLRDGISPLNERLHRFHGTSAIFESSRGLSLGPSTCATACTIFHRFYHSASLAEHDVWSVAMASTLLATKAEEDAKSLKQIVDEYARIYARRLVLADLADENENDENNNNKRIDRVLASSHSACLDRSIVAHWATSEERRRFCATRLPRQLNKFGPVYKEWHKQITKMESILLRRLGFTFYWISDSHPHRFVRDFCRVLRLEGDRELIQRAWDYCNDSCRLDLSVRYLPEVIASSAILLAARDFGTTLPINPRPWWEVFLGTEPNKGNKVADVANAILGTCHPHLRVEDDGKGTHRPGGDASGNGGTDSHADWLVATKGFVRPLVDGKEKRFNGPDSFLWFCQKETFEKEMNNESKGSIGNEQPNNP